jgi:baseplate J-like protein
MTKEKIIYLGPEEEMTNVRERLENTDAGSIILVIPPQTHLRSHVGWRLLRSRVRELGQDVMVISSDRQIRAVAKAAGFRVADSLESPPSEKPRSMDRIMRSNRSGKTPQSANRQGSYANKTSRSLKPGQKRMPISSNSNGSEFRGSENASRENDAFTPSTFEIEDIPYDSTYDLPFETIPAPQSGAGDQEDGEVDSLAADYYMARNIREAAQSSESSRASSPIENTESSSGIKEQSSKIPQPGGIEDDPLGHMEDIQPTALPEQKASTFVHDIDQDVPDISDVATDVYDLEVEDISDVGEGLLQDDWPSHASGEQMPEESEEQEAPLMYRMGNTVRPDFGNEDDLLPPSSPIEDQPTRVTPSTAARREPQPIIQPSPQARKVTINPATQQPKKPVTTKKSRVVTTPPLNRKGSSSSKSNSKTILLISSISLGVFILAFLLFLYFGSSATVTVVVPSQLVNVSNSYVASMNPQSGQPNTIPSQVLTYTASASGQGIATGTSKQGNQVASGTVTFTNTGPSQLDIPTGTVLSTTGASPVQFVTSADVLVLAGANNSIPSPVQAQLPGESGNVPANSITIIPPDSLTKIAKNNQGVTPPTAKTLTVTNPDPTTGGGASNVTAVTSTDANALAATLQQHVQKAVTAWLKNVIHPGDVAGPPVPNVVASATPVPGETFNTTPPVGQPAPGGKFTGVLTAKVSVLVIRNAAIQAAGKAQLKVYASHMTPPAVVATSSPATVKSTPSQDGKSLMVTIKSTGHVVQQVPTQQISQQLAGKSLDQAKIYINNGQAGITGVTIPPNIAVFPPFMGFMPFRPEQIHIVIQPGPVKNSING